MAPGLASGVDLVVLLTANLYNLLLAAVFLARGRGLKGIERVTGLAAIGLTLPLVAAAVLDVLGGREWWRAALLLPLISFNLLELLLDYGLRLEFRRSKLVWPYISLYYLGLLAAMGYCFALGPLFGFVTLGTYFLNLATTRYGHTQRCTPAIAVGQPPRPR